MRQIFLILLIALPLSLTAEQARLKNLIAIDTGWTIEGIVNEGVGWGILIDIELWPFLSARLRHGVVETDKAILSKRVANYVSSLLLMFHPWKSQTSWLSGWNIGGGFGYAQVLTAHPDTGAAQNTFLLPFVDAAIGYQWRIDRFVIEAYVSILLPLIEPQRSQTGIAMHTRHVDLTGITIGIMF